VAERIYYYCLPSRSRLFHSVVLAVGSLEQVIQAGKSGFCSCGDVSAGTDMLLNEEKPAWVGPVKGIVVSDSNFVGSITLRAWIFSRVKRCH
jgi:hypothetical protein